MKYLIISKGPSLSINGTKEHLQKAKETLQKGMDSGKVEACYGLVSGGTVWVINADSHAALARGLRKFHLSDVHDVEVMPILDGMAAIEAFISHK